MGKEAWKGIVDEEKKWEKINRKEQMEDGVRGRKAALITLIPTRQTSIGLMMHLQPEAPPHPPPLTL